MRMRNIVTKSIIGVALTAVCAFAADSSLGTWKLSLEKSKFTPSAPVKNLTMVREEAGNGVKVNITGEQAGGAAINANFTAKYDGSESAVTGAPYDTISIRKLSA